MWETLSDRPHIDSLRTFLDRLLAADGERVEFVALFGSMARGDWGRNSDYDVLVGLRNDEPGRQIDRLQQFDVHSDGRVEPISYTPSDLARMRATLNGLLLAALRDGVSLFDRGVWQKHLAWYHVLVAEGLVVREARGWRKTEQAYSKAAQPL